jgi:hypothetical protein
LADNDDKYLTPDEETEADHTRRKAVKHNVMSRLNAELGRQAVAEILTLREFNTAETWIIREQNGRRPAEQRATSKMIQEECIQDRVINATHQRASRKRRSLRFVWTAIGQLEGF